MADPVSLEAHGNFAQPEGANLTPEGDLQLILDNLPGLEDAVEFRPQLLRRLPGEDLEYLAAHDLVPAEAGRADLTLPIPDLDAVVSIDDIETDRKAVDDQTDEAAVLLDLPRLGGDLDREIGGETQGRQKRGEQVGHDGEHLALGSAELGASLQQAHQRFFVLQRNSTSRAGGRQLLERVDSWRRGTVR